MSRALKTVKPAKVAVSKATHPTREKLLESFIALAAAKRPEDITADEVLKHSGISRGSLYHHFQDFPDLVETALVQLFARSVDHSIQMLTNALDCRSKTELIKALRKVTARTQAPELRTVRMQRAKLIAFTDGNPRLAARLGIEQQRLTRAITDLIREAQNRGWMSKAIDPAAGAVLIQAYTLGRIVDDVGSSEADPRAWQDIIDRVVERVFIDR